MPRGLHFVLLICAITATMAERKRYDGYQQWLVTPSNRHQVEFLRSMDTDHVMMFETPDRTDQRVEMLLSPSGVMKYQQQLVAMGATMNSDNIQDYLDGELARLEAKQKSGFLVYDQNDYNTYDDINSELERLAAEECPSSHTCTVSSIGLSYEGREIQQLRITSDASTQSMWLDSLIHAREWLAGATVMRLIDYAMTSYGSDPDATYILDTYDVYVVPVMNPDGYEYSWTSDRFWRKSRNEIAGSGCLGTDLNRNYPVYWDAGSGSSGSACSDVYHGTGPASAPETEAVVNSGLEIQAETGGNLLVWISYHTNAEAILTPYGGTTTFRCNFAPDEDAQLQAGDAMVAALEDVGGLNWFAANACDGFYNADGITSDWTYDSAGGAGVKYSYTPELRGPGFNPDASFIPISFDENWAGLVALLREIAVIEGF